MPANFFNDSAGNFALSHTRDILSATNVIMEVVMREVWTDERLDDLNARVDDGFRHQGANVRELRAEMNRRFDGIDRRFDALQRTIIMSLASLIAIVGFLGVIASILATGA
jgi:hypothetical protein